MLLAALYRACIRSRSSCYWLRSILEAARYRACASRLEAARYRACASRLEAARYRACASRELASAAAHLVELVKRNFPSFTGGTLVAPPNPDRSNLEVEPIVSAYFNAST
jgi:hypothetical protein